MRLAPRRRGYRGVSVSPSRHLAANISIGWSQFIGSWAARTALQSVLFCDVLATITAHRIQRHSGGVDAAAAVGMAENVLPVQRGSSRRMESDRLGNTSSTSGCCAEEEKR
jgi:hypothetical protein